MAVALFAALGVWQIQRMHWKHALIARVDARVHAAPVALPADARLDPSQEYLRVRVSGTYDGAATSLVRATTVLGTGYWTLTPLRLDDGRQVWINRGFLPTGTTRRAAAAAAPQGRATVIGLLRSPEPKGSILQSNAPQDERWYSRDVVALARARGIGAVSPAFIDAQVEQAQATAPLKPVPGLTQIHFPDSHFGYALTWFAMAALSLFGLVYVWRKA